MWNRRAFLKSMGVGLYSITTGGIPLFLNRAVIAANQDKRSKTLIVIFQRGAMDGLMAVSPFRDNHLQKYSPYYLPFIAHRNKGNTIQ